MQVLYKEVDVFATEPYSGNPVAVFFDSDHLSTDQMQKIANWTNFSETTFILKPSTKEADYRVRIFTPGCELPFAGHPTIGTCHAAMENGICKPKNGKIVQECGVGLVELKVNERDGKKAIFFKSPSCAVESVSKNTIKDVEEALGLSPGTASKLNEPKTLSVGPRWLTIELDNGSDVLELEPNYDKISQVSSAHGLIGILTFGKYANGSIETRNFAPAVGVKEDPACGSGAASIGKYIEINSNPNDSNGDSINIKQGGKIGRNANLTLTFESGQIFVGGNAITCIDGKAFVP